MTRRGFRGVPLGKAIAQQAFFRISDKAMVVGRPRCPNCAGPVVRGEGCILCPVCGYSRCG